MTHGSGCTVRNTLREGDCDCTAGPYGLKAENKRLRSDVERLRSALRTLRPCSHACMPPCPHSRKFNEVIEGFGDELRLGWGRGSRG